MLKNKCNWKLQWEATMLRSFIAKMLFIYHKIIYAAILCKEFIFLMN